MKKLILASNSPRRKEILSIYTKEFQVITSDIDETIDLKNNLYDEIKLLSFKKAQAIFKEHRNDIVIGADTIVVYNNQILGKPKDENDARKMLKLLSGKTHEVITGSTVITKEKTYQDISISYVTFKKLSDREIESYLKTGEPLDKAGAYGIQGYASCYIKKINGDFFSIMGMHLNFIYETLEEIKAKLNGADTQKS